MFCSETLYHYVNLFQKSSREIKFKRIATDTTYIKKEMPGMFDTSLFLSLPIDIRYAVYVYLKDEIQRVKPPVKAEVFGKLPHCDKVECTEAIKTITNRYSKYIQIYDYIPNFVQNWCRDFELLKFDPITLDRLRTDIQYNNQLFRTEWIFSQNGIELGIYNQDGQYLQLSYSLKQYLDLIYDEEEGFSFGINVCATNDVLKICEELKSRWLFDTVTYVSFLNCWDFESKNVQDIISSLEAFTNLRAIAVEGQDMFENLINVHGFRDNPGKTIGYNVRQRTLELQLLNVRSLGYKKFTELTRWESLMRVVVDGCELIDLNHLILPLSCKALILKNIKYIIWWDQSKTYQSIKSEWIANGALDKSKLDADDEAKWASISIDVADSFGPITFLKLENVRRIKGKLLIPRKLWNDERIKIPSKCKTDYILLV